jgi:hypothetical protein
MRQKAHAFQLATKGMTAEQRAKWFSDEGRRNWENRPNPGHPRRVELSYVWRRAQRQDWRLA